MPIWQIVLFFVILGVMRVVQKVCSKKVSNQIEGNTYFHYGGYYQLLSAVFSLIMLFIVGLHGFNGTMMLCAAGTAAFIALALFTEIEALKGSSLIVGQMFQAGALFIPCLFGNFFIEGQKMNVWQWLGLCLFMVAMYLMISQGGKKGEKDKKKKTSVKTIIMLILMLLGEGGTMVVQNAFGNLVEDGNTAMYSFLMFAINALVLYICYLVQALFFRKPKMAQVEGGEANQEKSKEKALKPLSKTLLICGAFLAFALFMINVLVTELTAAVVPALLFSLSSAIAIVVTMLVGRFVYGEKMSVRNVIGIVLCAGSLAIISFL